MCQINQSKDVVCPTCGICPTCGRRTWDYNQYYYYYPLYKPDPTWPQYQYYQYTINTTCDNNCEEDKQDGK